MPRYLMSFGVTIIPLAALILAVVQIALPTIRVKQYVSLNASVPPDLPKNRDDNCGTVNGMRV